MAAPASDRSSDSSFGARATVESSIFANLATARGISNTEWEYPTAERPAISRLQAGNGKGIANDRRKKGNR
jgi:hypothetical protein